MTHYQGPVPNRRAVDDFTEAPVMSTCEICSQMVMAGGSPESAAADHGMRERPRRSRARITSSFASDIRAGILLSEVGR